MTMTGLGVVQAGNPMEPHYNGGSMVSYWAGAWCSRDTFVTAGTTGAGTSFALCQAQGALVTIACLTS